MRMGGEDYRLFVKSAGGTYNMLAGEGDIQQSAQTNMRDQSAKGDTDAVEKPGKRRMNMTVSGKVQLPDVDGLERIKLLEKTKASNDYQIRVAPFTGSDVIFEAPMYTSNLSMGFPDDDNATFSFQLSLAGATVKDQLTP